MAIACTIVARNYLPTVRVLQASFAAVHPDVEFVVLLIDDETSEVDAARERFRVVRLSDIGLPASEVAILAAIGMLAAVTIQAIVVDVRLIPTFRGWSVIRRDLAGKLTDGTISDAEIRQVFHSDVALVRQGIALMREHGLGPCAGSPHR